MLSEDFRAKLATYIDIMADPRARYAAECEAAENLVNAINSAKEFNLAYDTLDDADRTLGNMVADNADGAAYHPRESSGAAYIVLGDGSAILAAWNDSGFWEVESCSEEAARREIDARNAEYGEEEEESED